MQALSTDSNALGDLHLSQDDRAGTDWALLPPWHSVPIFAGRDLANDKLWRLSASLARSRRELARRPLRLPRMRRTSVSLLAAAIAAAAPGISLAHPGSMKTSRPRSGVSTTKTLTLGSRGPAVVELQLALGVAADGIFGPKTHRAVRLFQRRAGLATDGIAGPLTLAALRTSSGAGASILKLGSRGPAVTKLQQALGIPADGIFGKQTRAAVLAFQRKHDVLVDGEVGPQTRTALSARKPASNGATVIQLGDHGSAVVALQRALGIPADGIFGPETLEAVHNLQRSAGIAVDGIVGSRTRAALTSSGADSDEHSHPSNTSDEQATQLATSENVDPRLGPALALAKRMGLTLISGYRPGATIAAGGGVSDHSFSPSRAIDLHGSQARMRDYATQVAGMANVETVIFSPLGIWLSGQGWGDIRTSVTYQEHLDHVHVDTF